ncbi:aldehyde dehydrogenase family protein [Streptomyces sp. NP160]|uniref:aldehyde dehydrogenase family protein n=1 Tax=Streptomyces sp. NP160 TaxID=2586637 RepID=UPI00111A58C0|nr:aldehyde dehydrogenase family protein [Streptomyces sp. NP160]TNM67619.1 aldehyde dehydrogenase family protein [Streptomyces sp. NP160]
MTATGELHDLRTGLALPHEHVDDLFIDGRWVAATGARRLDVVDPATRQVWGSVPCAAPSDVDAAVQSAARAFREGLWPRLSPTERAEHLLRIADEVEARAELIALTTTRENGSPITETRGAAANAAGILRHVAGLAPFLEADDVRPFPSGEGETVVMRDPVGVCALIAPWNFPINLMVVKLAPALLAGCTVVLKPAETTPLSIRFVVEAVAAAGLPDGVVNLVTGAGDVGDALVRHPLVDKVAFTGSTAVGRRIAAACGELLRPVTLELGGKSSAVVLEDADLAQLAGVLLRSCLRNTGQTCYISTRLLAPASRYEEVLAVAARTVCAAPLGDPLDPATAFGPLANHRQYEHVLEHLRDARREGARVVTGGDAVHGSSGWFVEPTVLADVTPSMRVAREEVFGPVLTVMAYDDVDQAVELANSTGFGLGGLVFSGDAAAAQRVAERMDTGSVGLGFFASNHNAPFGGRHDSGLGVEYGVEGLHAYLTFKSIHRRTG